MPAAEGMVVATGSDDVREAREMALELLLSDHAGECVAPCAARCPAGLDIPGFVREIAAGDVSAIHADHHRAARAARRAGAHLPAAVRAGMPPLRTRRGARHRRAAPLRRRPGSRRGRAVPAAARAGQRQVGGHRRRRPGRAGGGVLPAAKGTRLHAVRRRTRMPGGMLRYGIPAYRLPKDALDAEIGAIRELGAEFRMNSRWGGDFTLAESARAATTRSSWPSARSGRRGCAAKARNWRCRESSFCEQVAAGNPPALGENVVVVGGGNTAMDCARSAVRLGPRSVRVLYRRTRQEMPCLMEEVEDAEAEGVRVEFLVAPVRLERGDDHRLAADLPAHGARRAGRLGPALARAGRRLRVHVIECSTVIAAIGQSVDRSLAEREGLRVTGWGIAADEHTLATNLPGVFAGGDAVLGADLAVRAVAAGRMAAASIDQFLRGEAVAGEARIRRGRDAAGGRRRAGRYLPRHRKGRARAHAGDRHGAAPGELRRSRPPGCPTTDAGREARRCLTCGCRKSDCCRVRTLATEYGADLGRFAGARRRFSQDTSHPEIVYEPGKCIMCDACVRIAAAAGEELGLTVIGRGFDVTVAAPFGQPLSEALRKVARRCAEACPTGALALRSARSCDLGSCSGGPQSPPYCRIQ